MGVPPGRVTVRASEVPAGAMLGLLAALLAFLTSQGLARPTLGMGLLLAWPVIAAVVVLTRQVWLAAVYLAALGVTYRIGYLVGLPGMEKLSLRSDVLSLTGEAVQVLLAGGNPYTHVYTHVATPNWAGFPYPPGSLLWYLPGVVLGGIGFTEVVAATLIMIGFAVLAWVLRDDRLIAALGLYASAAPLVVLSADNSNDTSVGLLLFAATATLLVARRRMSPGWLIVAAALMGWAVAFKQYALVFWVFYVAWLAVDGWVVQEEAHGRPAPAGARPIPAWLAYAVLSAGVVALLCLPFVLVDAGALTASLWWGTFNPSHPVGGWNVWAILRAWRHWDAGRLPGGWLHAAPVLVVLGVLGVAARLGLDRPGRAVMLAVAASLLAFFAARWTTYAYFAGIAPVALLIPFADTLGMPHPSAAVRTRRDGIASRAGTSP
ncbi:MAG: hypothetical protein QN178_01040 [Armatimonadota bacterium]|nr:hypothetical protein [Armatimonadota bacterium]